MFRDSDNKIISDGRYINEIQRVCDEGGVNILIAHPDRVNDDPNGSEAQIRPYVVWCLKNLKDKVSSPRDYVTQYITTCPPHTKLFHLFVRNDGTIQDLYDATDKYVIPSIKAMLKVQTANMIVEEDPDQFDRFREELEKDFVELRK